MGPEQDEVGRRGRRGRWPLAVAVALVAVAFLGAWAWSVGLPGYRPGLRAGERYGVDVSSHQGAIDWGQVAGDDIDFAYIKASEGSERPDRDSLRRELDTFLDRVEEATGQTVVVYVGADFEGRYQVRDDLDRPLWHRRVLRRPDIEGWWIWQAYDRASVDGIHGAVDLNIMRGRAPQR